MENHKKPYNLCTEELSRIMELPNSVKRIPKAGSSLGTEVEISAHEAADVTPISVMADARPAQGTKRQLSLSPQKTYNEENKAQLEPSSSINELELHLSKKRLVSSQEIVNLQGVRGETGNDPNRGHGWGGNGEVNELPSTESNMAAPTIKTMPVKLLNHYSHITPAINPIVVNLPGELSTQLVEGIPPSLALQGGGFSPNHWDLAVNVQNCDETEIQLCPPNTTVGGTNYTEVQLCPSNTTVGEVNVSEEQLCPSSTTAGEVRDADFQLCPSNMTVGEGQFCPSNTTVGEATPSELFSQLSPTTTLPTTHRNNVPPAFTSQPYPSNLSLRETPSSISLSTEKSSDFGVEAHPNSTEIENPLITNDIPSATDHDKLSTTPEIALPPGKTTPQLDPKKSRLRPRPRVTSHKLKSTPCSNCTVCKESTNLHESDLSSTHQTSAVPQKVAQHPPRGRGRPRKNLDPNAASSKQKSQVSVSAKQDSTPTGSKDLFRVLVEIKNELGEVKIKQEACKDDLCEVMDTKMSDFKQSLGIEINNVKKNVEENTTALTKLQTVFDEQQNAFTGIKNDFEQSKNVMSELKNEVSQNKIGVEQNGTVLSNLETSQVATQSKVENLDVQLTELRQLTDGMELEVIRQKKNQNISSLSMSTQLCEVEQDLAHHIETIKTNMEDEVSEAKKNQKLLENKLANFTDEIDHQNSTLNGKIQDLQKNFEQLRTLADRSNSSFEPSLTCPHVSESNSTSNSNLSFDEYNNANANAYIAHTCSNSGDSISSANSNTGASTFDVQTRFNSCDPNPPQNEIFFYMYGDTTRSVILDGLKVGQNEPLRDLVQDCINDMGIPITQADIENVYRIGKPDKNRPRPRPVKLVLVDQTVRDQIFLFKARLRFSDLYKEVSVNKEEPRDIRIKIAKLRQAGQSAKQMGYKVETKPGEVVINGVRFNMSNLEDIPLKFMTEANKSKPKSKSKSSPKNAHELSFYRKCRTTSSATIMVGLSLQKTPFGLAFFSHQCFLSNFYNCRIRFRNQTFTCLEQGYQCTKAEICDNWLAYDEILNMSLQADMKKKGAQIVTTAYWEAHKLKVMEELLFCKFRQNKQLYYSLLNTRPLNLIEATLDDFWGAGCILGSIALLEGIWEGRNNLGKLLIKVRNFFVKELEIGQGSIQ